MNAQHLHIWNTTALFISEDQDKRARMGDPGAVPPLCPHPLCPNIETCSSHFNQRVAVLSSLCLGSAQPCDAHRNGWGKTHHHLWHTHRLLVRRNRISRAGSRKVSMVDMSCRPLTHGTTLLDVHRMVPERFPFVKPHGPGAACVRRSRQNRTKARRHDRRPDWM
jgi:hypothetical protein